MLFVVILHKLYCIWQLWYINRLQAANKKKTIYICILTTAYTAYYFCSFSKRTHDVELYIITCNNYIYTIYGKNVAAKLINAISGFI